MSCGFCCFVALTHGVVVGLQCVIVVFPDHTHLLSTYFLHTHPYFKLRFRKMVGYGLSLGVGVIKQILEHRK